ncbi:hypothetical protein [Agrobacterium vitis]|uniref:Uncharacterized protein n=1 Tax=Agrobacterium vitis TaxID=373 RepID=A0A7K1RH28_AGRVI|nr:hypothetical protein [Agrobacterium vitis]MVA57324.1 hypothetical protein [Agrobacterium vitis]
MKDIRKSLGLLEAAGRPYFDKYNANDTKYIIVNVYHLFVLSGFDCEKERPFLKA